MSDAIETKQTELSTEPEITVRSLSDRGDLTFGKTVADLPRRMCILADVQCGIQCERRGTPRQQQEGAYWAKRDDKSSSARFLHGPHILSQYVPWRWKQAHHPIGGLANNSFSPLTQFKSGCSLTHPLLNVRYGLVRRVAALVFILLTSCTLNLAQSTNASLAGRITDPVNALIVDAKVAAISAGTNIRYEDTTNGSGEYHLTNLPPASYRLEIQKSGFKKLIKPDVVLHVQDALRIDLQMTLGDVTETVTVESGAPLVNTESGTVSTVINRTFVENVPLNGRSFQTLIQLTPGVVVTPSTFNDQGQFSVNGQRADANYFTVDGVSANFGVTGFIAMMQSASGALPALSASGGTNSLVSVDAMQEFRIQTSSFAPEFGRTPGGQVSIATRYGTNDFSRHVVRVFSE